MARIAEVMAAFPAPWALCGGWAVDAWLGRQTRDHDDIDISVSVHDQRALFDHLRGWQLIAHGPHVAADTSELWDGRRRLDVPCHIHSRPPGAGDPVPDRLDAAAQQGFGIEFQLDDYDGDGWTLSREPLISLPLRQSIQPSSWQVPAVVPEVLLFFKATELRRRDKLDFAALLPHLTQQQRDWLRDAIALRGHPWLASLSV